LANKLVLEPVTIDAESPSPYETYNTGLESVKLRDSLELELHGVKTTFARDWKRKYGKFNKKVEA
jgi:hypothetical protein